MKISLNSKVALAALLFMVPLSEVFGHYYVPGPINISVPNVINLLLFGAVVFDVARTQKIPTRIAPVVFIGFALMAHILFLALIGINNRHSSIIIPMTGGLILLFGLCYFFDVQRHTRLMSWSFCVTAVVLVLSSVLTILGFLKLPVDFVQENLKYSFSRAESFGFMFPRSTGISGLNMGAYGSYVEVGIFVCAAWGLKAHGSGKSGRGLRILAIIVALLLVIGGTLVTQSRSFLLAVGAGLIVFICLSWFLRSRSGKFRLALFIASMAVISFFGIVYMWEAFIGINPESVTIRLDVYYKALKLASESPILGNGFYAVAQRYNSHVIHNNYLAYFVSLGLVSFLMYISLFVAAFSNGIRYLKSKGEYSREMVGLLSGFAAVCTELAFYAGTTSPINFIMLGLLLSMGYPRLSSSNKDTVKAVVENS